MHLCEDSFNGEYELVLGGPLASRIETEKRPNELEKIEWTFICTFLPVSSPNVPK